MTANSVSLTGLENTQISKAHLFLCPCTILQIQMNHEGYDYDWINPLKNAQVMLLLGGGEMQVMGPEGGFSHLGTTSCPGPFVHSFFCFLSKMPSCQ